MCRHMYKLDIVECDVKADMKSNIFLHMAAIVSIEPITKTGFWLGVCHGLFHLQGLYRADRNASPV